MISDITARASRPPSSHAQAPHRRGRSGAGAKAGPRPRQPGADAGAGERFAEAWDEFLLAIRRSQARGQQSSDGLTLAQYYLLHPLERQDEVALCHLAESAGIAAPTATRVVDGLERSGVVRRQRSERDRRTVLVSLTPAGRKRLQRKHRQLAWRRKRLYESLEPDERNVSVRLLRHLAEMLGQFAEPSRG